MTQEHDKDPHDPDMAEPEAPEDTAHTAQGEDEVAPQADTEQANAEEGNAEAADAKAAELDTNDGESAQDDAAVSDEPEASDESAEASKSAEATTGDIDESTMDATNEVKERDRRAKDEEKRPAPKPRADAGLKPHKSATKAGKGKKRVHYNPGKTPPKPIELKDHSPWYIPWIGTGLIVLSLIVLVINYVLNGLPPFYYGWIAVCFVGMTIGLVVLSRWK